MSAAERYAKAMYEAEYDGETDTWPPPHPSDRAWWMHLGEVAAGVVADETEWEYEYADDDDPEGRVYGQVRRVVGPWVPVEP